MTTQLRDHVTTDPACRRHVPPTTWLARRRFEKARGVSCPRCMPSPAIVQANLMAVREELALLRAMEIVRQRLDRNGRSMVGMTGKDLTFHTGYHQALKDVLHALGMSSNGSMTPTFRISSPSEREQ